MYNSQLVLQSNSTNLIRIIPMKFCQNVWSEENKYVFEGHCVKKV